MPIRLYAEIAAGLILIIAFGLFVHHERAVGAQKILASDTAAEAALKKLTDAQTAHEQELATQAEQAAKNEQKAIDNYALTHPVGVVRLCGANPGGSRVPQTSPIVSGTQDPSPRPDPLSAVPASPDIGPALSDLMQSAARLAITVREFQQR